MAQAVLVGHVTCSMVKDQVDGAVTDDLIRNFGVINLDVTGPGPSRSQVSRVPGGPASTSSSQAGAIPRLRCRCRQADHRTHLVRRAGC